MLSTMQNSIVGIGTYSHPQKLCIAVGSIDDQLYTSFSEFMCEIADRRISVNG